METKLLFDLTLKCCLMITHFIFFSFFQSNIFIALDEHVAGNAMATQRICLTFSLMTSRSKTVGFGTFIKLLAL